ncbi:MAG TPA: hypothetical protein VKA53_03580, partial [Thermoanaerobaculia bacterium]|nr:hypothetical protein [Thermoanaerobaculia bacterium]
MTLSPAEQIFHPTIGDRATVPVAENVIDDRQRIAVLLEGAGLLSLLAASDWHLTNGWRDATLTPDGTLTGVRVAPGRERIPTAESLAGLLGLLFGSKRRISGRGKARSLARRMSEHWSLPWLPLRADEAVKQLLDQADFLWQERFAKARTALVGSFRRRGRQVTWVAGPPPFRRRVLRGIVNCDELRRILAGAEVHELWPANANRGLTPSELARQGRWTAAIDGWGLDPPNESEGKLLLAESLFSVGRFQAAAEVVKRPRAWPERLLRLRCLQQLGELATVRRNLARLEREPLEAAQVVAIVEVAARLHATRRDVDRAERWFERARSSQLDDGLEARLTVSEAQAAWDQRDYARMRALLARSARRARSGGPTWWRWRHARALLALAEGNGSRAADELALALRQRRRSLKRFEAGALWNDLVLARALEGDLSGAERACLKAVHLLARCEGPRRTTLALFNLAEIRLRRGRTAGVREILERSSHANATARNTRGIVQDEELWIRYEWVRGRPEAALERVAAARRQLNRAGLDWHRDELSVLAARTLGWLGRSLEAASELEGVSEMALAELEAEERPALWALAGHRDRACAAATGPTERLWRDLISAGEAQPETWDLLDSLEPYRAARCVFDAQQMEWVQVPESRLRWAAAILRRLGAASWAESLEASRRSPWDAVREFFATPPEERDLGAMIDRAGYRDARIILITDESEEVIRDRAGGEEEVAAPLAGARVVLNAPTIDSPLKALFAIAVARLRGRTSTSSPVRVSLPGSLVGESHDFRAALDRLERLAAEEVPILIEGESGTGK